MFCLCLFIGTFLEKEEASFFGCFRSGRATCFEESGQCLTGGRMPKQSSSLSFPNDMTRETEEADPVELELDETDSLSLFGAKLCRIWKYSS